MTSIRKIFVGVALEPNKEAIAVGIFKPVRRGVVEAG